MSAEVKILEKQLEEAREIIKKYEREKIEKEIMDRVRDNIKKGHAADCSPKNRCKKCTDDDDKYY